MELCRAGDLEALLRRREPRVAALELAAAAAPAVGAGGRAASAAAASAAARALALADAAAGREALGTAFQMAFSLFAARERLCLRHFDVKLLNFFGKPAADELEPAERAAAAGGGGGALLRLRYRVGERCFDVDLPAGAEAGSGGAEGAAEGGLVVKLADYGTASTNPATLAAPVRAHHFTTRERSIPRVRARSHERSRTRARLRVLSLLKHSPKPTAACAPPLHY
jgi:hypothetical protein